MISHQLSSVIQDIPLEQPAAQQDTQEKSREPKTQVVNSDGSLGSGDQKPDDGASAKQSERAKTEMGPEGRKMDDTVSEEPNKPSVEENTEAQSGKVIA